ncbi:hypothetical protein ACLOJK_001306 [Asimina triloba]
MMSPKPTSEDRISRSTSIRAIMAEYSGAVLGVLSVLLYGRRSHIWKKTPYCIWTLPLLGATMDNKKPQVIWLATVATDYPFNCYIGLLGKIGPTNCSHPMSYGLAISIAIVTEAPYKDRSDSEQSEDREKALEFKTMAVPITAGILSALRRVIARRVSLKGSSDSSTTLPFSTWVYLSVVLFGVVLIFYVDNIAEERNEKRKLLMPHGTSDYRESDGENVIVEERDQPSCVAVQPGYEQYWFSERTQTGNEIAGTIREPGCVSRFGCLPNGNLLCVTPNARE